jgi:hypothetical protein
MLRILSDFPDFKDEVKELMNDIEAKQKFFNAVSAKDYVLAYNLMEDSEDLQETVDGAKLQKRWMDDLNEAYAKAADGDIEAIKEIMRPYMKIRSKYRALATLFAKAYISQLEKAIMEKSEKTIIENGIKNYVLAFGVDDLIENLFEYFLQEYKDTKLNLDRLVKGSINMWRPSMIVDSIF